MIRINLNAAPHDLDLGHGVTVTVLPFTTGLMAAVRADLAEADTPEGLRTAEVTARFIAAVARRAITGWQGVHDEEDKPLDPTPEAIAALMQVYQIAEAFYGRYIMPRLVLDAEKKD